MISDNGYNVEVASAITALYDYMIKHSLFGGCHALSSVLFVALCELGLNPELNVGECQLHSEQPFDHSWICLDGQIIDISIYMPLTQKTNSISGPVILDIDVITHQKTNLQYGINTGLPMSSETQRVIDTPFCDYMNAFPMEYGGLWTVLKSILPSEYCNDIIGIKEKYKNTTRNFVR